MRILIPQMHLDLSSDPIDFLNSAGAFAEYMLGHGIKTSKLPSLAFACLHFNKYVGNVLNGGHSQFLGNSGDAALPTLEAIENACITPQLAELREIVASTKDWMLANPADAKLQTGFKGGTSSDLSQLDLQFYKLNVRALQQEFADTIRQHAEIEGTTGNILEEQSALARTWIATDFDTQRDIACHIFPKVNALFENPVIVGLGLVAGEKNAWRHIAPLNFGSLRPEHSDIGIVPIVDNNKRRRELCNYNFGPKGLTITPHDHSVLRRELHVSNEEIVRTQDLMKRFKMAQAVALNWWQVGRAFEPEHLSCYELPKWTFGKFQVRWVDKDWAVKGSPEMSTFIHFDLQVKERLTIGELQVKATDFGLTR